MGLAGGINFIIEMPPAREPRVIENKQSFLLTQEENQHLRRLLGLRCQVFIYYKKFNYVKNKKKTERAPFLH